MRSNIMVKSTDKKQTKEATLAQRSLQEQQLKDGETANSMKGTEAGAIWNEIKDRDIEMFALPDQKVQMHCHPINIEPTKLYLVTNSTAVLPSLETAVGKKFVVELVDRFVTVTRAPASLTKK